MPRTLKDDLQNPIFLQGAASGIIALVVVKKLKNLFKKN